MTLRNWFSSPFKFSVVPVSVLLVVVYGVVFAAVSVTDGTPDVPDDQKGLDLQQAYEDLHRITARPHPFISHDNDDVRNYLLNRLEPIVASQDYLHLSYDTTSNATWMTANSANYFEGNNILVKIDGTDVPAVRSRGVLFSAHYDSVSTAPGATDDGMGVVTLLQMIQYLAKPERRPRRTAIFFFNNGEEDGLNGAHLYFEHPWSKLTTTFINLEGAAAGGRPMLFRSTSLGVARSFAANGVHHPHGNVLSADAFARGVIRSGTDYSVYAQGIKGEKKGMEGLDFAFYKNRAFYHTPFDSVPGMGRNEGRKALWAMMSSVRGAGLNLLNGPAADDEAEAGVYFDILGRTMVAFSLRALFVWHIVGLVVGPLTVLGLLAWVLVLNHRAAAHEPDSRSQHHTTLGRVRIVVARVIGWGRFWLALLITIGLNVALVAGYVYINPYVIYSKPFVVLTTFLALSFLSFSAALSLFYKLWPSPPSAQKFAIILETYLLSWVFMVVGTIGVNKFKLGGPYLITVWYFCAWVTAIIALVEAIVRAKKFGGTPDLDVVQDPDAIPEEPVNGHRFVRGVMYTAPQEREEHPAAQVVEPEETNPTEITPLMQQHRRRSTGGGEYIIGVDGEPLRVDGSKKTVAHYDEYGWWIVQAFTLIPLPTILLFQVLLILVHSLRNTLADGNRPIGVYAPLALLSVLLFVNIAPFAHQIERTIHLAVLIVFAITLIYAWTAFPFTQEAPLKVYFEQSLELGRSTGLITNGVPDSLMQGSGAAASTILGPIVQATTVLAGISGYVDKKIVRELPSSWRKDVTCNVDEQTRVGLLACRWASDLIPSPGGNISVASPSPPTHHAAEPHWLSLNTTRTSVSTAEFRIRGFNTRSCQLHFDHPIHSFRVLNGGGRQLPGYDMPKDGVKTAVLYSRAWEKEFVVEVGWAGADEHFVMEGRAACEWAEYASATAGGPHAGTSAQIPALEEVKENLPLWAVPTKYKVGLVEAWTRFRV